MHAGRAAGSHYSHKGCGALGNALEDVGEVVHQLGKCDGHSSFNVGCQWLLRVGGYFGVVLGTRVILHAYQMPQRFLQ